MLSTVLAFLAAFVLTLLIVYKGQRLAHLTQDADLSGPQKFHELPVPRVGGVGIFAGVAIAALVTYASTTGDESSLPLWLVAAAMPVFLAGLLEDLTKKVRPRERLLAAAISGVLGFWWIGAAITRTDLPGLDWVAANHWGALALTAFAVAGVSNAVNIIDGFNGLASMCVALMLGSIAYVAFAVGDPTIGWLAVVGIASVLGFFAWNFPGGYVFLGDGGAYFLGFYVAELAILLIARNPDVSPLFPLLIAIYPVFETVYSIYRRKVLRGSPVAAPDGAHLHSLIYRRFTRWASGDRHERTMTLRNSLTSPYLWVLCMLSLLPAVVWWDRSWVMGLFVILFAAAYLWLYWRIVRFRVPRWMRAPVFTNRRHVSVNAQRER